MKENLIRETKELLDKGLSEDKVFQIMLPKWDARIRAVEHSKPIGKVRVTTYTENKLPEETFSEYRKRMEDEGNIVEQRVGNLVMTAGKEWLADRSVGTTAYQIDTSSGLMAFGVGSTAPAVTDAALEEEAWRVLMTSVSTSANVATFTAYMSKAGSNDNGDIVPNGSVLREVSMFAKGYTTGGSLVTPTYAVDTGMMANRATFAAISKTDSLALTAEVDWTID